MASRLRRVVPSRLGRTGVQCRSGGILFDYGVGRAAMQYLLLIYVDETQWANMPEPRRGEVVRAYREFTEAIVKAGQLRAAARLSPSATATTVREARGRLVTTDGPFAETKEQLGGYYLVECANLDEAVALAARIPAVRQGGSVEVRPVMDVPAM
jgi:hypothetical protein